MLFLMTNVQTLQTFNSFMQYMQSLSYCRMDTGDEPKVKIAANIFRDLCYNYRDSLSAGIIVAGWDKSEGGQVRVSYLGDQITYLVTNVTTTYIIQLMNYRLLMRSTRYHVDRVWYWLTDAVGGGLPIPDKVYMVPSRPKSKVYNCFIKLSGILHGN